MSIYKRKIIKKTSVGYNANLMERIMSAYQTNYPVSAVLNTAGIEFPDLFQTNVLEVCYDITFGGAEQLSAHNGRDSLLIVRRTGVIMITFTNPFTIQQYIGRGRFKVLTNDCQLKTLWIDSKTLEPQYK